ncbi:MAG TPA: plastocyanin/azurin family copper-binding protein [Edaphocola sp.]|nr:plastocyanin/azurin family copper-binding protein [Edaphocola sp.]
MFRKIVKLTLVSLFTLVCLNACNTVDEPAVKEASPASSEATTNTEHNAETQKDATMDVDKTSKTHYVTIEEMKFNPEILEVKKGDEIVFTNKDIVPHDVTEVNKAFQSPTLNSDDSWKMKAEKSVDYFCSIHLVMKGKIIVK